MEKTGLNYLFDASKALDRVPDGFFDADPNPPEKKTQEIVATQIQPYLDPRFKCPVNECTMDYGKRYKLKKHIMTVHPGRLDLLKLFKPKIMKEDKAFPCPIKECPSGFLRRRDLARHMMKMHTDTVNSAEADH